MDGEHPAPEGQEPETAAKPAKKPKRTYVSARIWRQEVTQIVSLALIGAAVGWLFGHPFGGAGVVLAFHLVVYLRHLQHLSRWLESPKTYELPEPTGLWGRVFEALQALDRRNRKRKKRLAQMVAEFQASTAALPDGAVVLGESGEIHWFNRAAQALLGLRGQDYGIRIPNLIRHPVFADYFSERNYEGEAEVPSPINRAITLSLRIIPYGNNQRLLIVRNISEIRRLETARRDFVSNASHELRTPLTVLRGYLDMIEPETRDGRGLEAWRMPISEMRAQAARMESLINDMLKLAKLESDVYETREDIVDVPPMLRQVVEDARAMSQGQHRFEVNIEPGLCLYGRETEAQSIFSNLVNNAVRYTPPGGVIRISWWGDAEGGHLAVADSGIGIAEADIPRLTERFYRVDVGRSRASGGTGLGLSIAKHALERHEGRLQIESELGVGSSFYCHFPPHRMHRQSEIPQQAAPSE